MPRCPLSRPSYFYINPKAPKELADFLAKQFAVAIRVSATFMQEKTGGFDDDEGPSIAEYAAVLIDEEEDIRLFEPVIPREMSDERA
jgi:hypothetical protein